MCMIIFRFLLLEVRAKKKKETRRKIRLMMKFSCLLEMITGRVDVVGNEGSLLKYYTLEVEQEIIDVRMRRLKERRREGLRRLGMSDVNSSGYF